MKSNVTHFWTSGNRNSSPVPVVWAKSEGARTSGLGDGKLVSAGLVARAVSRDVSDSGGVIRVMSDLKLDSVRKLHDAALAEVPVTPIR